MQSNWQSLWSKMLNNKWYEVPESYRNGRTIACLVVPIKNLQIEEDITDLKQQKTQQAECVMETC